MLNEIDNSHRKFDVIGFGEFEYMSTIGPNDDNRWIERVKSVFENLDTTGSDKYDERYNQLRSTFLATAQLFLALTKADSQQQRLMKKSIALAEKFTKPVRDTVLAKDTPPKNKLPNKRTEADAVRGTPAISAHHPQPQPAN